MLTTFTHHSTFLRLRPFYYKAFSYIYIIRFHRNSLKKDKDNIAAAL